MRLISLRLHGEIVNGDMRFTAMRRIATVQWNAIPQRFADVQLDEFVVMPNHIHGIITIVGAPLAGAQNLAGTQNPIGAQNPTGATARVAPTIDTQNLTETTTGAAPTIGDIVGAFKSLCLHHGLAWIKQNDPNRILGKLWQRNYWEHIIRNETELNRIREYIHNNPVQWEWDKLNSIKGQGYGGANEIHEPSAIYGCGTPYPDSAPIPDDEAWMI